MDFGSIRFLNARVPDVEIALFGSGTYDFLAFGGPNGSISAIEVDNYNDTTFISDQNGNPNVTLGGFGGSGYCNNTKNVGDANTVELSGVGVVPIDTVNVFDPAGLTTYPFFPQQGSGTVMIEYTASGVSEVNTFNAQLYSYDPDVGITTPAEDVDTLGFEINGSGLWRDSASSGIWNNISSNLTPLQFVDHSSANNYLKANKHIWVAAISARPRSIGQLRFRWAFTVSFA